MTNFISLINKTAERFEQLITSHHENLQQIPTEDFGWSNKRWVSKKFRLAHIELFEQPKFSVLHTVVWPYVNDPSPIFGFDIIASDTKATGLFFDLSPTVDLAPQPILDWTPQEPRERPEWGSIFSKNWVACRPSYEESRQICGQASTVLASYLLRLGTKTTHQVGDVVRAQNQYSIQQRKNEHTTRVILKLLGQQQGTYFIENILFPTI